MYDSTEGFPKWKRVLCHESNQRESPGASDQPSSSLIFWPMEAAASQINSQEPLKMDVTGVRKSCLQHPTLSSAVLWT
jgi:hypothetical protein